MNGNRKKVGKALLDYISKMSFPGGSEVSNSTGDSGAVPGLGRTPGEGNVEQLQYSCLESSMGGRA